MSGRIVGELSFFAHAFVWGAFMMLVYGGLRLFRHFVGHGTFWLAVEDLAYWIAYGLLLFRMIYLENDGMIRGFALLAVFLGMLSYFRAEKFLIYIIKKLQKKIRGCIMKHNIGSG